MMRLKCGSMIIVNTAMTTSAVKKELEDAISKPFREIQNEIQRITNIKYVRDLRFGSIRRGFKGFRIKSECIIDV